MCVMSAELLRKAAYLKLALNMGAEKRLGHQAPELLVGLLNHLWGDQALIQPIYHLQRHSKASALSITASTPLHDSGARSSCT